MMEEEEEVAVVYKSTSLYHASLFYFYIFFFWWSNGLHRCGTLLGADVAVIELFVVVDRCLVSLLHVFPHLKR